MKLFAAFLLLNLTAQSQNVFIRGTVSNYNYEVVPFFKKDYTTSTDIHIPVKKFENNYYELSFNNPKPQLFKLFLEWVYIEPGDSVQFDFSFVDVSPEKFYDSLVVKTKYPGNYTLYNHSRYWLYDKPEFNEKSRQAADSFYTSLKNFYFSTFTERINEFTKKNPVSSNFRNYLFEELKIKFLNDLLHTFKNNKVVIQPSLYSKIEKDINASHINNELFIDAVDYVLFGEVYLEYFLPKNTQDIKTVENYLSLKKMIEKQFDGKLEEFWKSILVRNQYFNKPAVYIAREDSVTNAILASIKDSAARHSLASFVFKYANRNEDAVKKIQIVDLNNNVKTIGQVIEEDAGVVKIIDFWASWCGPCIKEGKKLEELKDKLGNVKVIKISVDEKEQDWRQAVEKHGYSAQRQYLVPNKEEEKLTSLIDLMSIPRFLIVTKNGKIAFFQAFGPSVTTEFLQQIKFAESMENGTTDEDKKGLPPPPGK
jgi:thiol-disulfide isomerase/thioredoxin